jgi:tetratricopeptide (TPR) repeat protein
VISRDSLGSKQITKEVDRAHECDKPFIPLLRDVTHVEFQNRQPEWRQAIGTATSIRIPPEGISAILPRIVKGLKALGIDSGSTSQQTPPPSLPDGDPVINELTKKIQQDPENPLLYNDRGIAYYNKGDYDKAIADYTEAIRLDPKFAIAYKNRSLAYKAKGKYDLALADYAQAVKLDPKLAD